ncbi:hypothetical protein PROPJV5_0143 [Propionibacterium ruminifibrarum]|uniref:Restriction endonuclease n=1 Tax=Propionibacterium ruminifibrarum TaxID=1962131 RepID=A0A375HXC4_9ACTN|nr:hypothetical protein [Propionibacterium ruminifibrarum]SPF67133.1 hypothetical protein PROPJV5_0143 [Propionibacterium ruminifibrarum]
MNIIQLREWAIDKSRFTMPQDYLTFATAFMEWRSNGGMQAELVAKNDHRYRFIQFKEEAGFQISRPINSDIFYDLENFEAARATFIETLQACADGEEVGAEGRRALQRVIYTSQQTIGAALDALPVGASNQARKVNGDLFERFIGLLVEECGAECHSGVLAVPVKDENNTELFKMNYQHDLMVEVKGDLKAIGSVKTSSKDRLDKVFIDKFLYNRLTSVELPHFAIFLHDVQRKGKEPNYGISQTFLRGHFKGYTVKLNPLDGVFYCDLLPMMESDPLLRQHIRSIDHFFVDALPKFIESPVAGPKDAKESSEEDILDATD